jgi:hypothetical protein
LAFTLKHQGLAFGILMGFVPQSSQVRQVFATKQTVVDEGEKVLDSVR